MQTVMCRFRADSFFTAIHSRPERYRLHPARLALFATLLLMLAACGGNDAGDISDKADAVDSRDTAAAEERVKVPEMTGEDGWVELHDMDIPAAGTAVMTIDGTRYDVDIKCDGPGVFSDDKGRLFLVIIEGQFELADGRSGYFDLRRWVNKKREDFYPYDGQDNAWLQVVVDSHTEGQAHSSTQGGPNDFDPKGESLPLLHAQPDGSFTVDSVVNRMPIFHGDALDGPITLAGRCPEPWGS